MGTSTMRTLPDGTREWLNAAGQRHREDGPAAEFPDGSREWYVEGELHREDGPAIEQADGTRVWFVRGQLHREDGPALEVADGRRDWFVRDQRHREDGPAIEWADGTREWWVDGEQLDADEVEPHQRAWNSAAREARTIGTRHPTIRELLAYTGRRAARAAPALTPLDAVEQSPPVAVKREPNAPRIEL